MYGTFSFLDSRKFDMGQFSIPMKYNFIKFPISDQALRGCRVTSYDLADTEQYEF